MPLSSFSILVFKKGSDCPDCLRGEVFSGKSEQPVKPGAREKPDTPIGNLLSIFSFFLDITGDFDRVLIIHKHDCIPLKVNKSRLFSRYY